MERAGARALNALVWLLIISVLVLTGRSAFRSELIPAISGDKNISALSRADSKINRAPHSVADAGRNEEKASAHPDASGGGKNDSLESVRAIPHKIDENYSGAGVVAINSYTQARIYINGQFSGTTPRTIRLSAGDHQIRLTADGYDDWTRRIRLKTKQQLGIMASMKRKGPAKN
ncbi:MAG: PEGA domain-containing protein [Acidobacteria bacterium]|nr:PEGA domain-containing protein [Acidobacteriota bacterium]